MLEQSVKFDGYIYLEVLSCESKIDSDNVIVYLEITHPICFSECVKNFTYIKPQNREYFISKAFKAIKSDDKYEIYALDYNDKMKEYNLENIESSIDYHNKFLIDSIKKLSDEAITVKNNQ